jgi:hypothetical protein
MNDVEIALGTVTIAVLLIVNGFATREVLRDRFAERHQRMFQLVALWLVPVFGAILVFATHRKPEESPRKYPEIPDPGDDFGASGQVGRSIKSTMDD